MPYKRTTKRKRSYTVKKRTYKKNGYKKRSGAYMRKQLMMYDGGHKEKIITNGDLITRPAAPFSGLSIQIPWETN